MSLPSPSRNLCLLKPIFKKLSECLGQTSNRLRQTHTQIPFLQKMFIKRFTIDYKSSSFLSFLSWFFFNQ